MADDQDENQFTPDVHFEPVVKLPLVEIKTLEENEDVLFKMRAKLFRYNTTEEVSEWKERGTGEIKILKQRDSSGVRILMRRDKTLKICANHYILPCMELKPNNTSDRAWIWNTVADFADEQPKPELLAIKFGNPENAQKFKAAFEEAKKLVASQVDSEENDSDSSSNDEKEDAKKSESESSPCETLDTKSTDSVTKESDEVTEKLVTLSVKDDQQSAIEDTKTASESPKKTE